MALIDTIRNAVAIAKRTVVAGGLTPDVTVENPTTDPPTRDSYGAIVYGTPATYSALVEDVDTTIHRVDGSQVICSSRVSFLEDVPGLVTDSRITIGEKTALVERVARAVLPTDASPFLVQVYLGKPVARTV